MLNAKFLNFKPKYIAEILTQAKIPFKVWNSKCSDEIEVRIDLSVLQPKQERKVKKIVGINTTNINYIIFF